MHLLSTENFTTDDCSEDFNAVFLPILQRVALVLRRQLELATGEGKEPKV